MSRAVGIKGRGTEMRCQTVTHSSIAHLTDAHCNLPPLFKPTFAHWDNSSPDDRSHLCRVCDCDNWSPDNCPPRQMATMTIGHSTIATIELLANKYSPIIAHQTISHSTVAHQTIGHSSFVTQFAVKLRFQVSGFKSGKNFEFTDHFLNFEKCAGAYYCVELWPSGSMWRVLNVDHWRHLYIWSTWHHGKRWKVRRDKQGF